MQSSILIGPAWPPELNPFLAFGLLILAGLAGGKLASRTGYLPRITGFIIIGFLLGPNVLGLISPEVLEVGQQLVDVALGLILFSMGRLLDLRRLRRERALHVAAALEGGLSFILIFAVLAWMGLDRMHAALAAAIGISSSPAVVLLVVRELNAQGPLTDNTLMLVALNNILCFLVYTALLPFLHYSQSADAAVMILQPLYKLFISLALAWLMAVSLLRLARHLGQDAGVQFALVIGFVVGAVGLAKLLNASTLLTLLTMGVMARNLDWRKALLPVDFGHVGEIFFVILFVVAGANLHIHDLATAGWASVAFVLARSLGKSLGVLALYPRSLDLEKATLAGLTLTPMAGMAIGLTRSTAAMYPEFAATLSAIVLGAIVILETLGPIATEYALKRAGEVGEDARIDH